MARERQTETAVLGALSVEPMTGYAIRMAIRDVLGHFWSESFGQIYPTLADLERQGHVTRRDATRAHASMFEITDTGLARLRELLTQPIQPTAPRNGLMLRLFFGRHLGPDACRELLAAARADAGRQVAQYAAIRAEILVDASATRDRPYWLLTVSAGEQAARATIAWADELLAALDELDASPEGDR